MAREEKVKEVEEMSKLMNSYPTIGFIDLSKLPTKQFQKIRKELNGDCVVKISKKIIIKFALKKVNKENIAEIENIIPSQPGVVLTNLDAFKFYKSVSRLKPLTFAKEGDVVGVEIEIKPGPTDLLPGPVISEFAKVGLAAGVDAGKIAIKRGGVVAKKGSKVSKDLSSILRKLKIEPIEISLNITALYDSGKIYKKDVLRLVEEYPDRLKEAFSKALNFSVAISFPTKENVKYLFAKAYQQAKALKSKIGGI